MKKNLIFILISLTFLSISCNTTMPIKGDALIATANIQHQLDNPQLKINPNDSPAVVKQKKEIIKVLEDAKKEIAKEEQDKAKLEKQKDDLQGVAGVGRFMWAVVGLVACYFIFNIVKRIIP